MSPPIRMPRQALPPGKSDAEARCNKGMRRRPPQSSRSGAQVKLNITPQNYCDSRVKRQRRPSVAFFRGLKSQINKGIDRPRPVKIVQCQRKKAGRESAALTILINSDAEVGIQRKIGRKVPVRPPIADHRSYDLCENRWSRKQGTDGQSFQARRVYLPPSGPENDI